MGRTAKNPGKPKGKVSAYAFFMQEMRDELKRKDPSANVSMGVVSKQASAQWKALNEKDRKKYVDLAAKDQERYKEEMASYTPADGDDTKKRKRGKKDPNAPKRAMSAFFCFSNEERAKVRAENPKMTVGDVAKELGRRWETIKDRSRFEALAAKDKARYEMEKAEYANGQTNGEAPKKAAPKNAKKTTKPPAKKTKRSKDTEEEDEDEVEVHVPEDYDDDDDEEEDEVDDDDEDEDD